MAANQELHSSEMLDTIADVVERLFEASFDGNLAEVMRIIEDDSVDMVDIVDDVGWTPLHYAAYFGHMDIVLALLEAGANPNNQNEYGETALHFAALFGHLDIVETLLVAGINPNKQDDDGKTALHWAAKNGDLDVFQAIVAGGGDPNIVDGNGKTAYTYLGHAFMIALWWIALMIALMIALWWTPYYVGAAVAGALVGIIIISNWLIR